MADQPEITAFCEPKTYLADFCHIPQALMPLFTSLAAQPLSMVGCRAALEERVLDWSVAVHGFFDRHAELHAVGRAGTVGRGSPSS
jgi:hypothetical protein